MKKHRKDENIEHYVKLDNSMTESAAWTSLSSVAVWVYIELRKRFTYEHEFSRLVLPYSTVNWKMSPHTYSKAIKELVKYGFIRYVEHGGLPRRPNVFALSDSWKKKSTEIVDIEGREAILLRRKGQRLTTLPSNQLLNQASELSK